MKDKLILTFTILTGITLATAAATATLRSLDPVILHKMVVARMDPMAVAAASLMENWLIDVVNRG
ncbi:Uncharacterised protein [Pantoea agglomerans]|uniref:Uncharacterized protein n=1 Tax=Enterobacter agglomerans TaxID=549 RepID=A0A379AF22_ENTAG|nr:Uncharacterised protein [Pantoea agglomerans]